MENFIMPGILDTHVHVTIPVGFEYADIGERLEPNGKQEALNIMAKYIHVTGNMYEGTAEHEGFSYNKPRDVYFSGKKVN